MREAKNREFHLLACLLTVTDKLIVCVCVFLFRFCSGLWYSTAAVHRDRCKGGLQINRPNSTGYDGRRLCGEMPYVDGGKT